MQERKAELEVNGHEVTARWVNGNHEWEGQNDDYIPEGEAARYAMEDLADIDGADLLIAFTEEPDSGFSRGGRHVEMGYALGKGVPIWIVGPRENVFANLDQVTPTDVGHFATWQALKNIHLPK